MAPVLPPLLRDVATDEYVPPAPGPVARAAAEAVGAVAARAAASGTAPATWAGSRTATAASLRALDAAAGGSFFAVPEAAAEVDADAESFFGALVPCPVVDVQTHLLRPSRFRGAAAEGLSWFLRLADPDRWGDEIDPRLLDGAAWARHVFGSSETAVALLTSFPGRPDRDETVLTNGEIAVVRDLMARYGDRGRVLTHAIVHPNDPGHDQVADIPAWTEQLRPAGWKVYTLWEPPERTPPGEIPRGWFLDDDEGLRFLEAVRDGGGPRVVCAHKGISSGSQAFAPSGASPRDVGPAARAFPELSFVVYHSGFEPNDEEGPWTEATAGDGVNRLVTSLAEVGIGPGGNVYAELGSTWFILARRPLEAAHVVGKLLAALGPERILWGTDCIWYGSPQPLIDAFRAFEIPTWMQERWGYPPLDEAAKRSILGENAARLYGLGEDLLGSGLDGPARAALAAAAGELAARLR